jgi:hypothetical protein
MRYRINLATQPYQNERRFYSKWSALLILAAVVTGILIYGAVSGWRTSRVMGQKIAVEKENLKRLDAQEQADLAILNKPENRDVREKSQVLNGLIRRKEFSWTLIFADMERIMPTRIHVISITPRLAPNNDIELRLMVAGDSREKAIELIQHMEASKEFRDSRVLSESNTPKTTGQPGEVTLFEVSAVYVPAGAQPPAAEGSGK